jgi:hypothetical protein
METDNMANDSYTQQALAADPRFQMRVRDALSFVAWEVLQELPETPNHPARETYARTVINNLAGTALQVSPWLVGRPGVFAFETSYNFPGAAVVTAAGDADIQNQLADDWDELAGVSTTPPV